MNERESKVFAKLKGHLTNIGEYKKFENFFSRKDRSLDEKFGEIWEREDLRAIFKFLPPKILYNRKDDKLAKDFIAIGDRYFGEKSYAISMQSYNLAILAAKNTKIIEHLESKSDEMSPLVLAYAMRSALLYEMCKYEESIRDIDKAIEFGYPSSKISVLEQRRANCLFGLNKLKEAEKTVRRLLEKEDSSKNEEITTGLKELLQKCKNKGGMNNPKKQRKDQHIDPMRGGIFYTGEKHPLILKRLKKDNDVNLVSDRVKIDYHPSKGRRLVASKDIEPGELLLAERAYTVVSSMTKRHRAFCCVCLRRVLIAFPCNTCSLSCYCSEECMTSKRNVHPLECPVFIHLVESKADPELALAFRTLLKFKMEDILSDAKNANIVTESVSSLKEAESFFNSPMSLSSLFKLEGNIDKRSGDSIFDGIANAVIGVKLLQKIPQFWERKNPNESKIEQSLENLKILGGELTKLLLIFQCNIHSMVELSINYGEKLLAAETIETGFAVFKKFSMMNHSCNPNALNSCWGDIKYLYSINFIPKGAEIFDSYGERYSSHELKDRKFSLLKTYHFECECEACEKDWPIFNEIRNPLSWLCPGCKVVLNSVFRCENCENGTVESSENEESKTKLYDSKALAKEIAITHKEYEMAYRDLSEYKSPLENIKYISKRLSLLSKYSKQPTKEIIEAQELMLRAHDLLGSYSFKGLVFI